MFKTTNGRTRESANYNLQADIQKLRGAFYDTASGVKGKATEMLSHSIDGLKDQSTKLKNNVANYTSEKPFKSLGITLLAGIAIGWLLKR